MKLETSICPQNGDITAFFRLPSDRLSAVEKEVLDQQGRITIDAGGLITDSTVNPPISFTLPSRTVVLPNCIQVSQLFASETYGSMLAANNAAQAWLKNINSRVAAEYAAKQAVQVGDFGCEVVPVQPQPGVDPEPLVPFSPLF